MGIARIWFLVITQTKTFRITERTASLYSFIYINYALAAMTTVLKTRLEKSENYLLAQCITNPSIIVSGKNRTELKAGLATCIAGYVEAFPKSKKQFFVGDKMKKVAFVEAS